MDTSLYISVILDVFARYPPNTYSLAVLSSVKFKYLTTVLTQFHWCASGLWDKLKTIKNIFPVLKQ